jgi:hypothetical protein
MYKIGVLVSTAKIPVLPEKANECTFINPAKPASKKFPIIAAYRGFFNLRLIPNIAGSVTPPTTAVIVLEATATAP